MKITVITATYNSASTLEQTISSVVNQSYTDIEYILVDGASTDNTIDIIKKYKALYNDTIRYISEPDNGIYDAFNKGISMATGDYIYFLGSDDSLYDYTVISRVVDILSHEDIDLLCAGVWCVDENKKTEGYFGPMGAAADNFDGRNLIHHQGEFAKRDIIATRLFDTSFKVAADYNFFLSCYYDENIKVRFKDIPIAFFSTQGASNDEELRWQEQNRVWERYGLNEVILRENKKRNKFHNRFKRFLRRHGLYDIFNFHLHHGKREVDRKHTCSNKVCRWCGRNEGVMSI
ncbi:glycosyltransferase family 2 protein [Selenomonas ruminantium]|uniref:glycosyltransferase family 2 protein n=1 Tax=Selenomonas ruminantium TaxID=971 RepID=UPI00041FE0F0|nr:glycosyltransferase family 2 protein [Selenomonas ruminantium]